MTIFELYSVYAIDSMFWTCIFCISLLIFACIMVAIAISSEECFPGFIALFVIIFLIIFIVKSSNEKQRLIYSHDKAAIIADSDFRGWTGKYYPQYSTLLIEQVENK